MRTTKQTIETLNEAMSENGIVCFHAINQPLVNELCEIIRILYRELQSREMGERDIEKLFGEDSQPMVPLGYSSYNQKTGKTSIRTKI